MADPETPADLAAQLEDLQRRFGRHQATVASWETRFTEETSMMSVALVKLKQLSERLDEVVTKNKTKSPPAPWWGSGDREELQAELGELREWVDRFARIHYPAYMAKLPLCICAHPEAIWELSTLKAEWDRIYADEDNRDLQGALTWHEKWLPGVLGRLAAVIRCDPESCQLTRQ
jgi:chromosome segregation ATPase